MGWVSSKLSRSGPTRVLFDPHDRQHVEELAYWVHTGRWRDGCPFLLEDEAGTIPHQCVMKYLLAVLPQPQS